MTYQIVVEAPGFQEAILEKLKVDTATTSTANFSLETGAVAETVTVSSEAALIPVDQEPLHKQLPSASFVIYR